MIDQPTETQNRENPATQSHGSKVNLYFDHDRQTAAKTTCLPGSLGISSGDWGKAELGWLAWPLESAAVRRSFQA
jgi:hypothetical protein